MAITLKLKGGQKEGEQWEDAAVDDRPRTPRQQQDLAWPEMPNSQQQMFDRKNQLSPLNLMAITRAEKELKLKSILKKLPPLKKQGKKQSILKKLPPLKEKTETPPAALGILELYGLFEAGEKTEGAEDRAPEDSPSDKGSVLASEHSPSGSRLAGNAQLTATDVRPQEPAVAPQSNGHHAEAEGGAKRGGAMGRCCR
eukprot:GHVQ01009615.1.p1 GENE.GHVQ01009615.1~~GHVQ01009615.1.p1  ORF type:complete len:225 (-),score=44.07 GHVQ01009615.1:12-605(-)